MLETGLNGSLKITDHADRNCTTLAPTLEYMNYTHADEIRAAIKAACAERLAAGRQQFVVDLSAVKVMDSCGLSVLISLKKQLESGLAYMAVAAPSPMIQRLFVLTKLDRVFPVFDDLDEALASMS